MIGNACTLSHVSADGIITMHSEILACTKGNSDVSKVLLPIAQRTHQPGLQ